jgi:acetyl-CoA carboxylase biotin carboxyl carrier protein
MSDKKKIVDKELIRELADLLNETGLSEIEVEHDEIRIRVARTLQAAPMAMHVATPQAVAAAPAAPTPVSAEHPGTVPSPMVGTAYLAPEPGGKPFVDVGDTVREGQTLLIVEAMKTMNQIPSPRAGKITRIMVEDGQPVEYGEPLMIIE